MSKYKVGDKVVLEITDKVEMEEPWYILSDATSIYGSFMDKAVEPLTAYIEQARADGAETAWELVRKIFDMETNDIEDIFITEDAWNLGTVLNNYTYAEAAAKVAEWKKAKEEIKVGDIVTHEEYDEDLCVLCMSTDKKYYSAVGRDGAVYYMFSTKAIAKTGRHIDIDGFLKQIGGEQE